MAMANEIKINHPNLRVDIIEQDEVVKQNLNSLTLFSVILAGLILIVTAVMANTGTAI